MKDLTHFRIKLVLHRERCPVFKIQMRKYVFFWKTIEELSVMESHSEYGYSKMKEKALTKMTEWRFRINELSREGMTYS